MKLKAGLAAAILTFGIGSGGALAASHGGHLTLDVAKQMADACEAMAKEQGWKMNIAIVDDGADTVLFRRMDGAFLGSVQIAKLKAETSADFPFSTRMVGELAFGKDGEPGRVPGIADIPGIAAFPGGLPIMNSDEKHLGGIGISGATGDQDEQCAQAAIDAVKDQL